MRLLLARRTWFPHPGDLDRRTSRQPTHSQGSASVELTALFSSRRQYIRRRLIRRQNRLHRPYRRPIRNLRKSPPLLLPHGPDKSPNLYLGIVQRRRTTSSYSKIACTRCLGGFENLSTSQRDRRCPVSCCCCRCRCGCRCRLLLAKCRRRRGQTPAPCPHRCLPLAF